MPPAHGGNGHGSGPGRPNVLAGGINDRLPPQHIEAEQGVLGSILIDNEVLHDIIPVLKPEHFYRDSHQILYRAIRDVYEQAKAVDSITLEDELRRRGELEKAGGLDAIVQILSSVPHSAHARYYAQIVREKAVARELIETANEMLRDSYSNNYNADELLTNAERRVFAIAEDQVAGETVELKDVIVQAMERIDARVTAKHPLMGVGSGFLDLDDITTGFKGQQLIIVAAGRAWERPRSP